MTLVLMRNCLIRENLSGYKILFWNYLSSFMAKFECGATQLAGYLLVVFPGQFDF